MPIYHQLGRVPRKRHVAFRKDDGSLYYEELVGNQGFAGLSSLLYHLRLPTAVKSVRPIRGLGWVAEPDGSRTRPLLAAGVGPALLSAEIGLRQPPRASATTSRTSKRRTNCFMTNGSCRNNADESKLPKQIGFGSVLLRLYHAAPIP